MPNDVPRFDHDELTKLRKLSARLGSDLRFTQASSGNSSIKLDRTLWIKASGMCLADALHEQVMVPLDLADVKECLKQQVDPAGEFVGASIETAMHAVLPHRVVLHLHCVNTIAWAVCMDAPGQLERKLIGMNWRWIPYVPSGLPLAHEIEKLSAASPESDVFVLGNHGLVIGADDCESVENLLTQVEQRLSIPPRVPPPPDLATLTALARNSGWDLPVDQVVHALGTD